MSILSHVPISEDPPMRRPHHFKENPKCGDGTIDTSLNVSGKGVKRLKKAGCKVITGVLETECRILTDGSLHFMKKGDHM